MPSGATTRASHAFALADLCNDAAGGHPGQRATILHTGSGTFQLFYQAAAARYVLLRACVVRTGIYSLVYDGVTLELSITDGTTAIPSSDATIPEGLGADLLYQPGAGGLGSRLGSAQYLSWYLDVDALVTAGLDPSVPWRLQVIVVAGATAALESFTLEEAPRFLVGTADGYGQIPQDYLPRAPIVDGSRGLERLRTTMRAGHYLGLRTYHAMSRAEAAPIYTTSGTFAALTGDTEAGTTATKYKVRARKMRGAADCPVAWLVRYKIVGASPGQKGQVRLYTGGAGSPYTLDLTDVSGSWATSPVGSAALSTAASGSLDTLYFAARTDGGTLSLCARTVWDNPA